jgi:response regulator RpfG family c-di-GMP phosphodiesterase
VPGEPRDPQVPDELSWLERPDIGERLLRYFRQNPTAMDSVEGIARFWVHEEQGVVERCLKDLHARDFLDKRTIAGTDFYYTREPRMTPAPPEQPGPRRSFRTTAPGRILIVEDDPGVRDLLQDVLGGAGHEVSQAPTGRDALALLDSNRFHLVVTDVLMPGMSGLEVLQEVKRRDPTTEVIVITGHPNLDTALEALHGGAYDLVAKPFTDLEFLHRLVERALDRQRLTAESGMLVATLQARNRELSETVGRLALVNEIGRATTALFGLKEICDELTRLVAHHFKARRVSVLMAEPDSDLLTIVSSVGIVEPEALQRKVKVGEGLAGRVALTESPLLVADIEKSDLRLLRAGGRYSTPSFMITPLTVTYPIRFQRRRLGVINVSDKHSGAPFNEQDLEFLSTIASQVAVAMENARLMEEMERGYLGLTVGLIQAVEESRPRRRGHSQRVIELATQVGRELGLEPARLEVLRRAAALHEVGRILRPGGVGRSAGPQEVPASRVSPTARPGSRRSAGAGWTLEAAALAESVLAPIASLKAVREVILHSTGRTEDLPEPLPTEQAGIPLEAGILAACEELIDLAASRVRDAGGTRPSPGIRRAFQTLLRLAGGRHDPDVIIALGRVVAGRAD